MSRPFGGGMQRSHVLGLGALAVLLALALGSALESAADAVWTPLVAVVAAEILLMTFAVALRPEKRLPFFCPPFVLFVGFQAQFFVVGPLLLPYSTFISETSVAPRLVVLTVAAFIGLLATFFVG